MATNYPVAADTITTLPNPTSANYTNNPDHAQLHDNENDAIKALETKIGTGASTPTLNQVLIGTGAGTSGWGAVPLTPQQWQTGIPVETPNSVRTLFTVPSVYIAGSLQVTLNGLRESFITESSTTTFSFSSAPIASDIITLFYRTT